MSTLKETRRHKILTEHHETNDIEFRGKTGALGHARPNDEIKRTRLEAELP